MAAVIDAIRKSAEPTVGIAGPELVLARVFDAPRRLVFKAWVEPERLVRWFGPQGFSLTTCKMDVRPGGPFEFCLCSPDGVEHWWRGAYCEVLEPERLVLTTTTCGSGEGKPKHETTLTVTFDDLDGKTRLTLRQGVFETVASRDDHDRGWTSTFGRLADYLALD